MDGYINSKIEMASLSLSRRTSTNYHVNAVNVPEVEMTTTYRLLRAIAQEITTYQSKLFKRKTA